MGIKIKKIMYYIINKCGIPFLVRNFFQRNKVTILLFHDLKTDSAAKVLKFVKDKYNIIKLDTFINAIKNQTASSSYKPATLDCGIKIYVPPFVESGEKIIIDTRTLEYIKKI